MNASRIIWFLAVLLFPVVLSSPLKYSLFFFALVYSYLIIPSQKYKLGVEDIEFKENITIEDIQQIHTIITQLKPEYKSKIKKLIVHKNLNEDYEGTEQLGIINIEINSNISITKLILCHEILHTIIYKSSGETFVYDISEYGVCYT